MSEAKTKANEESVEDFLRRIADETVRFDCEKLSGLIEKITGEKPKMWGASIVGFGDFHYEYASGRTGDTFVAGFAARKQNITLYLTSGAPLDENLLARLGKYKAGKGCLSFKTLNDVDADVLEKIIEKNVAVRR